MKPSLIAPKVLAVTGFLAAVTAGAAGTAWAAAPVPYKIAQNYPWCLISSAFEGGENCGFVSFAQCMASRAGVGGFCQTNTQYRAGVGPPPSPAPARRMHQPS
jgi:hypothetical protein